MRSFIIVLTSLGILCSFTSSNARKGCSGVYYMQGKAFSESQKTLNSITIQVIFDEKKQSIVTDDEGNFELIVPWINTCKSKISEEEHEKINARLNPQFILFKYDGKQVKLTNDWKRFANCFPVSKESITCYKELHFD